MSLPAGGCHSQDGFPEGSGDRSTCTLFIFAVPFGLVPANKVVISYVKMDSKLPGTKNKTLKDIVAGVVLLFEHSRIDSQPVNHVSKKPPIINGEIACCQVSWKSLPVYIPEPYSNYQRLFEASLLKYTFQVLERISW